MERLNGSSPLTAMAFWSGEKGVFWLQEGAFRVNGLKRGSAAIDGTKDGNVPVWSGVIVG